MKKPIFNGTGAKVKASFKSRSFRVGGYSVAATVAVIAIAVVINLLINQLPSKTTQIDVSANQMFTLSEQTEQIVSGLTGDTTIYWLVSDGKEDSYISQLLDRYLDLSDKLTVTKVDPVVYPNFASKYTSEEVTDNGLIVTCSDKSQYVANSDMYENDYSNYMSTGSYTTNFAGESCITSAIDYVISDDLPKVYMLTGHGETALPDAMKSSVQQQNIELADLTLLNVEAVPEDADCVLILGPTTDITADEATKLQTYVVAGGNLLLFTGYSTTGADFKNLIGLMENYGVTTTNSLVIEGDSSRSITGYNYYLLPEEESHTITSPLIDAGYYVLTPLATGITKLDATPENVSVSEILKTSDGAYAKANVSDGSTIDRSDDDVSGPFDVGVAIEYTVNDDTTAHIVWYSSASMLDDSTNKMVSGGNEDLFINSLGWMCDRADTISIHSKSLDSDHLTVSSSASSLLSLILVGILPLGFLAVGIYVWVRRKRR